MSELRECPYGCEQRWAAVEGLPAEGFYGVCNDCGCRGPLAPTRDDAVGLWNTRPADAVREAAKAAVEEWIGGDPDEFLIAMGRLRAVVEEK